MLRAPVPYDPDWPNQFARLRDRLRQTGAPSDWQIAHIGSTAVPGLMAKPIIDMQIGVPDLAAVDPVIIERAGFAMAPEITRDDPLPEGPQDPTEWRKSYARFIDNGTRIAHLHIRQIGRANHRTALVVRDYLRASRASADLYALMKQQAAFVGQNSDTGGTGIYGDVKDPFVKLLALRAQDWAKSTGWQVPPH